MNLSTAHRAGSFNRADDTLSRLEGRKVNRRIQLPPDARHTIWAIGTAGLLIFFVAVAGTNLDNFRPVSSDEAWIMSASYKLATQGVFGSDLFAGFFNAERHYFISLPAHHFLQAISFQVFGTGVAQARWVSLASGALILWVVGWLAYRWYGLLAGLLAGALLVGWRSDLIAAFPGLPLLSVARSGRYDASALAWMWLTIGLFEHLMQRPSRKAAVVAGLSAGLATLTQFFGAFVLPAIALAWLWQRGRQGLRESAARWMLAGFLLVVAPYAGYAASHASDLAGQTQLKAERVRFDNPRFYLDNVIHEPARYRVLWNRPSPVFIGPDTFNRPVGPWLLLIGAGPASAGLLRRMHSSGEAGDRLLGLSLLLFAGLLALLEQTKAPLYAIVLLPSLCLTMAAFWVKLLNWAARPDRPFILRMFLCGLCVAVLAVTLLEGVRAYRVDVQQSSEVSNYLEVGRRIDAYLTPGARVLGAERWWWALHRHPYLALNNLWWQWLSAYHSLRSIPEFAAWVERAQARFIIVNNNVQGDIRGYPDVLQQQFWRFLETCGVRVAQWIDLTYGNIQIYRVRCTVQQEG